MRSLHWWVRLVRTREDWNWNQKNTILSPYLFLAIGYYTCLVDVIDLVNFDLPSFCSYIYYIRCLLNFQFQFWESNYNGKEKKISKMRKSMYNWNRAYSFFPRLHFAVLKIRNDSKVPNLILLVPFLSLCQEDGFTFF